MSDLHDARVEPAVGKHTQKIMVRHSAADAVLTVEEVARAIDPDSWRLRDAPQYAHLPDEAKEGVVRKSVEQAERVLALIRGGGERC